MIAHDLALGFAIAVEAYWIYNIYREIQKGGTWYNELKMSDDKKYNFKNKLIVSFCDRFRLSVVFGVAVLAPIVAYIVVRIFILGMLAW